MHKEAYMSSVIHHVYITFVQHIITSFDIYLHADISTLFDMYIQHSIRHTFDIFQHSYLILSNLSDVPHET